ncbi:MAG TPA: hypothetical protein P5260_12260 [Candidatus Competibacter sp.]|jgi:hypothetical protein|nr:hypothetical protein [Candidatus Competibacter sp.]
MNDILRVFMNVRVKRLEGSYLLNKPLLLLLALERCQQRKDRLAPFSLYEDTLLSVSHDFGRLNVVFPFGRLLGDGVWEIPDSSELYKNSSGDLLRSELIEKNIVGGFPLEIYSKLSNDSELIQTITIMFLKKYIPQEKWETVISKFNITFPNIEHFIQENRSGKYHVTGITKNQVDEAKIKDDAVAEKTNSFISYLNSLHNLQANGANALAESQALSPYFGEIYESFPLIDKLIDVLKDGVEKVIILTGHAGDGKSTVALDVLKKLRSLPLASPLSQPLDEREDIGASNSRVTIVKDMSELSTERRQQWLHQAFSDPGSWLIISNTGPLLHSIVDYAKITGTDQGVESKILECLDRPLSDDLQNKHSLNIFAKKLVILNLTRLDNVDLGAKILTKLVKHSAWKQCEGCSIEPACPLMLNRKALLDAGPVVEERVRWVYQRLNAYEKRLTLRQIVAQLALGLTGGMSCEEAQKRVVTSMLEGPDRGSVGLERILFSESFFGYRSGKPWLQAEGLHAVALLRRATFGAPVAVDFERRLPVEAGIGWAMLPPALNWIGARWRQRATESAGVNWRFALRRMAYLFGRVVPDKEDSAAVFIDTFLQSPSLRDLDQWKTAGKLTLSRAETNRLRTSCLRVLLEIFSGFSAGQFRSKDSLYLTLCRSDKAVVQPTQLVSESLPFKEFDLRFDPNRRTPVLDFGNGKVELLLTLPLLDYIRRRDAGELGNELSPIHQAQLDWFRAELSRATNGIRRNQDQIELLQVGIDGEVHFYRFFLDRESGRLEQCY